MKILEKPATPLERICIYGDPKTGKTRLATSLPWGEYWGEKAVYVAYDPSSASLRPVRLTDRGHLLIVEIDGKPNRLEEAVSIATKDWKAAYPEVGTLIWDTMSHTGKQLLHEYADTGVFSDRKPLRLGKEGTKSWHTSPVPGDYGAVQNSIGFLLTHLWNQPLHLIILFHAKWIEPKEGAPEGIIGGPDVPGSASVRAISGHFDTVFRTDLGLNPETKRPGYVVHSVTKGIWKAGFRTPRMKQALATTYPLGDDPTEFWKSYTKDVTE